MTRIPHRLLRATVCLAAGLFAVGLILTAAVGSALFAAVLALSGTPPSYARSLHRRRGALRRVLHPQPAQQGELAGLVAERPSTSSA